MFFVEGIAFEYKKNKSESQKQGAGKVGISQRDALAEKSQNDGTQSNPQIKSRNDSGIGGSPPVLIDYIIGHGR